MNEVDKNQLNEGNGQQEKNIVKRLKSRTPTLEKISNRYLIDNYDKYSYNIAED